MNDDADELAMLIPLVPAGSDPPITPEEIHGQIASAADLAERVRTSCRRRRQGGLVSAPETH